MVCLKGGWGDPGGGGVPPFFSFGRGGGGFWRSVWKRRGPKADEKGGVFKPVGVPGARGQQAKEGGAGVLRGTRLGRPQWE